MTTMSADKMIAMKMVSVNRNDFMVQLTLGRGLRPLADRVTVAGFDPDGSFLLRWEENGDYKVNANRRKSDGRMTYRISFPTRLVGIDYRGPDGTRDQLLPVIVTSGTTWKVGPFDLSKARPRPIHRKKSRATVQSLPLSPSVVNDDWKTINLFDAARRFRKGMNDGDAAIHLDDNGEFALKVLQALTV